MVINNYKLRNNNILNEFTVIKCILDVYNYLAIR